MGAGLGDTDQCLHSEKSDTLLQHLCPASVLPSCPGLPMALSLACGHGSVLSACICLSPVSRTQPFLLLSQKGCELSWAGKLLTVSCQKDDLTFPPPPLCDSLPSPHSSRTPVPLTAWRWPRVIAVKVMLSNPCSMNPLLILSSIWLVASFTVSAYFMVTLCPFTYILLPPAPTEMPPPPRVPGQGPFCVLHTHLLGHLIQSWGFKHAVSSLLTFPKLRFPTTTSPPSFSLKCPTGYLIPRLGCLIGISDCLVPRRLLGSSCIIPSPP